ncbi:MAG: head GIN domain-containing protein [Flavobacteriaceae bacterium]
MFYKTYKLTTLLFLAFFTSFLSGQNSTSDEISEKTYEFSNFDTLELSHAISVILVQSDTYRVAISCEDKYRDYVVVSQNNSTLKIRLKGRKSYKNINLSAVIHMPTVKKLEMSGASKVVFRDYKDSDLELELSGASSVRGIIALSNSLTVDSSGASDIKLEGTVKNADVEISGASSIKCLDLLIAQNLDLEASGASNAKLIANGRIKAKLSGASSFKYGGDA